MAEPQATREKEGARQKLLLQTSHLVIHPKKFFAAFPVVLGLANVCSKIPSCSFRENGSFGDAAKKDIHHFPEEKKTMEELASVSCLLGTGKI